MFSDEERSLVDAAVLTSARLSKKRVVFYLTNRQDAEWIYTQYDELGTQRKLEQTEYSAVGREHYIELSESDEHSLSDEDAYSWNEEPVWMVSFTPTEKFLKRAHIWYNNESIISNVPRDFEITQTIAEIIYRIRVHEMKGDCGYPILEFELEALDELEDNFESKNMVPTRVKRLFRLDAEDSAIFRTLVGVDAPETEVQKDAEHPSE